MGPALAQGAGTLSRRRLGRHQSPGLSWAGLPLPGMSWPTAPIARTRVQARNGARMQNTVSGKWNLTGVHLVFRQDDEGYVFDGTVAGGCYIGRLSLEKEKTSRPSPPASVAAAEQEAAMVIPPFSAGSRKLRQTA